jgi:hypothetical protein
LNKCYLPNLFRDTRWKDINDTEKKQFGEAFIDNVIFDPEAND